MGLGQGGNGSFSGGGLAGGGGPLGAMGMDLAPYKMPIIGSKFQDPNQIFKQQQFHEMARSLGQYRPEMQQGYSNALNQVLSTQVPINSAMAQMYGPEAQQTNFSPDQGTGLRSPFGPSALQVGQSMPGLQAPGMAMTSQQATPSGGPQGLLGGILGGK